MAIIWTLTHELLGDVSPVISEKRVSFLTTVHFCQSDITSVLDSIRFELWRPFTGAFTALWQCIQMHAM